MADDYYALLGVPKDADEAAIKTAYRKQAMRWHPDRNPGAEAAEKFKRASEAYAVLSNPDKRAAYDRLGHAAFRQAEAAGAKPGAGGPGFPGFGGFGGAGSGFEGEVDINDLLSEVFGDAFGGLFGGGAGRKGPPGAGAM